MNVLKSQSTQAIEDENSNFFLTNSIGKFNQSLGENKNMKPTTSWRLRSSVCFSAMESVSFSSTTEDDDTTEIEQHYEEKIRQLQNEGLRYISFM